MGYNVVKLKVSARISNHNDHRDTVDAMAWDRFRAEVSELAKDPRYRDIHIDIMTGEV